MNQQEKVKAAIERFRDAVSKQDEAERKLEEQRDHVKKAVAGVEEAKQDVKRVLHAVYGEKPKTVIMRLNGQMFRFCLEDGHLKIGVLDAEIIGE